MSRYIDAERLKWDYAWFGNSSSEQYRHLKATFDRYVDGQPTADVRENIHAHWIKHEDKGCWYCSHCKEDNIYAYFYREYNLDELDIQDLFCPKCGAQMDERREDD